MCANILLHPSTVSSALALLDDFMAMGETEQLILATLIQVKAAALETKSLPESLIGIMQVLGSIPRSIERKDLDDAEEHIYNTLRTVAAREHGDISTFEQWHRDIS